MHCVLNKKNYFWKYGLFHMKRGIKQKNVRTKKKSHQTWLILFCVSSQRFVVKKFQLIKLQILFNFNKGSSDII